MKRAMRYAAGLTLVLGLALVGCDSGEGGASMEAGVPEGVDVTKKAEVAKTGMGMMGPGAIKKEQAAEKAAGNTAPTAPGTPE